MVLKAIAIILVVIAVAVAAVYIMGQFEQTKPFHDQIMGYVNQAKDWVTQNWAIASASIGSIVALGGSIVALKSQVSNVKKEASNAISGLTTEKDSLQAQLTEFKEQTMEQTKTAASGYEAQIADLKQQLENSSVDVKAVSDLKAQLHGAQDMHNNFVAQLTSGSQQVIDPVTNQVYKLITLEKTVFK